MSSERYAGTLALARVALRRDRLLVAVWGLLLVAVVYASAAATGSVYPTVADRVVAARAINDNPAVVALYGPILDVRSLGELAMTKVTVLYAIFLALLLLVVVRRHTRTEEEGGHAELLAATAVGRDALLAAAVVEGALVSAAVGALAALADVAGGLPARGSVAFGLTWLGIGLVATGVTAAAAQVSASARTCGGIAGAAVAVLYLLRAVGDAGPGWLSWLSPFGWNTRFRAWGEPRWWLLLLYVALAALTSYAAVLLRSHRDLGSGLVAARPGPARGTPRLSDAVALAWRLQRTTLAAWTVGAAALGVVFGAIAPSIRDLLDTAEGRRLIESIGGVGALEDALVAAVLAIGAVVVTGFGLTVVGRGSGDERDGRTEQVLATATSRSRSLVATLVMALLGTAWLLAVIGLATGLGLGRDLGTLLGAALAQVPAVWVVVALGALLFAIRSGWAVAAWGLVGLFFVLGQLGDLLHLPGWVTGLSPYAHSPAMPVDSFTVGPELVLTAIAAVLLTAAWVRFRRRDIG